MTDEEQQIIGLDIANRGTVAVNLEDCFEETFKEEVLTLADGRYHILIA